MSREGIKHLVQCHCVLPQYRGRTVPVFHKFVVFSVVEDDKVTPKIVNCGNCGAVHKVFEIGRSEIVIGKDDSRSAITVADITPSIPVDLQELLSTYNVDIATWEEVAFSLENEVFGKPIVLLREEVDGTTQGKYLEIVSRTKFKVVPFVD